MKLTDMDAIWLSINKLFLDFYPILNGFKAQR